MIIPFQCSEFNRPVCYNISDLIRVSHIVYYYTPLCTVHSSVLEHVLVFPFKAAKGHFQLLERRLSFVCLTQVVSDNDYLRSYFSAPMNEFDFISFYSV